MHPKSTDQVHEQLPNGEYAWLRQEPEDERYVLTDEGRRALAMDALFGSWPTVVKALAA